MLTCRRLIIAATVLHLLLAIALFIAGRAGAAPSIIDRDGIMGSFAFDSYNYQHGAIELAELLRRGHMTAWATAAQPVHVKIIAVPFALLSPLFGYSTLSAEPYNLVCYITIIAFVFALGREVGGHRSGVLAAAVVALWPTFLLHTMQLLKDPLFITAVLAFLFCAITLLDRTYRPVASAGVSILAILLVLLLIQVRVSFVLLLIAVALLTLMLLLIRQARERRLLVWNMAPALTLLLAAVVLTPFYSPANIQRSKRFESDQAGPLKSVVDPPMQVPTLVRWIATPESNRTNAHTPGSRFARRISSMRSRFAAAYSESGSLLDANAEFRNVSDLIRYVPRAMQIGLWAPFPYMWISAGRRVGNMGKLLSGIETLVIYFLQALAIVAIVREPRRLALWFVLAIVVFGVTALAFVVPNVGAIYRFRYVFWILLVVVAMAVASPQRSTEGTKISGNSFVLLVLFCCWILSVVSGCSSLGQPSHANFAVNNWTGTAFQRLYLSPSSAPGWEENVLAGAELKDGDTLDLQFDPKEQNLEWDLRIEGVDGHYAEWKNMKLSEASEVTMVLKLSPGPAVVAEVE